MFEFKSQAYADGDIIFSIGDLAEHLYFIEDGQVDLLNAQKTYLHPLSLASLLAKQPFWKAACAQPVHAQMAQWIANALPQPKLRNSC